MQPLDTIAAIATPAGRGGIGIVRLSGPLASHIATSIVGKLPLPRVAQYGPFHDQAGEILDMGLVLFFPKPHSFTGEDVIEFQGHGGPTILNILLKQILHLGARLARPGEFSERAFLNDKIDLTQAEAIADLIDAASEQAARCAVRSLQGMFSEKIHALVEQLIQLRIYVEAAIDFPEEEIDFLSDGHVLQQLNLLLTELDHILATATQGQLLREGITIVIAGSPNAGKSSLLNCLSGKNSAIVTDMPGTTRDTIREYIHLDGLPLHIIDTAGLRSTDDIVEQAGIQRAWDEIQLADHVLWIVDSQIAHTPEAISALEKFSANIQHKKITVIQNKIDLLNQPPETSSTHIHISAKTGFGIEQLKQHLKDLVGFSDNTEGGFIAKTRHIEALKKARTCIIQALEQLNLHNAGELVSEELRQAQCVLGEITGTFNADALLGRIFTSFCIGK